MTEFNAHPPAGSRDFLPEAARLRRRVFDQVREVFESHGFEPMDTPAFERVEVLAGKYGDEGEKLIFKILKRGEQAASGEADLALRYDLTIPFARVVAAHQGRLPKIFKRYQIGPVWRADRPGRGRFREFYQCDVDTVGSASLAADAEVLLVLAEALAALGFGAFQVKLNSRKALKGLLEAYDAPEALHKNVLVALDKLDKMGLDKVRAELAGLGLPEKSLGEMMDDLADPRPERIRSRLERTAAGRAGLAEVNEVLDAAGPLLPAGRADFTPFLARGLDYYTGPIFEIYADGLPSSIASGGRYDGLIGLFTKQSPPVCGGSLGIERVLLLMEERAPSAPAPSTQVLVTVWDKAARNWALGAAQAIRREGLKAEVYLGEDGLGRQMAFAADKRIPFAVIRGPDEQARGEVSVKDLAARAQAAVPESDLPKHLKNRLIAHGGNP